MANSGIRFTPKLVDTGKFKASVDKLLGDVKKNSTLQIKNIELMPSAKTRFAAEVKRMMNEVGKSVGITINDIKISDKAITGIQNAVKTATNSLTKIDLSAVNREIARMDAELSKIGQSIVNKDGFISVEAIKQAEAEYQKLLAMMEQVKNSSGTDRQSGAATLSTQIALMQQLITYRSVEAEQERQRIALAQSAEAATTQAYAKELDAARKQLESLSVSSKNIQFTDQTALTEYGKKWDEVAQAIIRARDLTGEDAAEAVSAIHSQITELQGLVNANNDAAAAAKARAAEEQAAITAQNNVLKSYEQRLSKIGVGSQTSKMFSGSDLDDYIAKVKQVSDLIEQARMETGEQKAATMALANETLSALESTIAKRRSELEVTREQAAAEREAAKVSESRAKQIASLEHKTIGLNADNALNTTNADHIAAYNAQYQRLISLIEQAKAAEAEEVGGIIAQIREKITELEKLKTEYNNVASVSKEAAAAEQASVALNERITAVTQKLQAYISNNPNAYKKYKTEIDELMVSLTTGSVTTEDALDRVDARIKQIGADAKIAGVAGKSFWQQMKSGWEKFGGWTLVTRSFTKVISTFKQAVTAVKEVDSAMTELRKVTDLTDQGYQKLYDSMTKIAGKVGAKLSDTINSVADFSRLGYDAADALKLSEAALTYFNVGDDLSDIGEATESIISTMKAFGIEANNAMSIVDKFNEVGNNFAISSSGIGEALQRSASALATAGNTIEQSIGLIVAANDVVQNPEAVGTAMKTLTMYLRAAKTEAEAAGIETDGMATSVAKLREELLSLTGGALDIQIDENNFKSSFEILRELSEIWDEIGKKSGDVTQANILNLLGGKRNANVLASIIMNFQDAIDAAETAGDSMGSALAENEKYLNSIEGKTKQVEAAFQTLANSIIQSDIVKTFLDIQKAILNIATELNKVGALLPALATLAVTIKTIKDAFTAQKATQSIMSMIVGGNGDISGALGQLAQLTNAQKMIVANNLEMAVSTGAVSGATATGAASVATYATAMTGATAASVGFKGALESIKAAFMSNPIGIALLAITAGIALIKKGIDSMREAAEAAVEKADQIRDAYDSAQQTYDQNVDSLEKLRDRFDELNERVGENGTQGSLTNDEYEEYLSIVKQIIAISPGLANHYTNVGEAIQGGYVNALKDAIEYQKQLLKYEKDEYLAGGGDLFEGLAQRNRNIRDAVSDLNTDLYTTIDDILWEKFDDSDLIIASLDKIKDAFKMSSGEALWDTKPTLKNLEEMLGYYDNMEDMLLDLQSMTRDVTDSAGNVIQVPLFTDQEIGQIRMAMRAYAESAKDFAAVKKEATDYLYTYFQTDLNNLYDQIPIDRIGEFKELMEDEIVPTATLEWNKKHIENIGKAYVMALGDIESALKSGNIDAEWDRLQEKFKNYPSILAIIKDALYGVTEAEESAGNAAEQTAKSYEKLAESMDDIKKATAFLQKAEAGNASNFDMLEDAQEFVKLMQEAGHDVEVDNLFDVGANGKLEWDIDKIRDVIALYVRAKFEGSQLAEEYPEVVDALVAEAIAAKDTAESFLTLGDAMSIISNTDDIWQRTSGLFDGSDMEASEEEALKLLEDIQKIVDEWNKIKKQSGEEEIDISYFVDFKDGKIDFSKTANGVMDFRKAALAASPAVQALEEKFPGITQYLEQMTPSAEEAEKAIVSFGDALNSISESDDLWSKLAGGFEGTDAEVLEMLDALQKIVDAYNEILDPEEQIDLSYFVSFADGKFDFSKAANGVMDYRKAVLAASPAMQALEEQFPGIISYFEQMSPAASDAGESITDAFNNISSAFSYLEDHIGGGIVGSDFFDAIDDFLDLRAKFGKEDEWTFADFFEWNEELDDFVYKSDVLQAKADEVAAQVVADLGLTGDAAVKATESIKNSFGETISKYEELSGLVNKISSVSSFNETIASFQNGETGFLDMLSESIEMAETFGLEIEDVFDFTTMQPSAIAVTTAIESAIDKMVEGKNYSSDFVKQLKDAAKYSAEVETNQQKVNNAYEKASNRSQTASNFNRDTELTYETYKELIADNAKYAQAIEYVNGKLTINKQKYWEITQEINKETQALALEEAARKRVEIEYWTQELAKETDQESENAKAIKAKIQSLELEAKGYEVLANELDNAADAFARFAAASDSTETSTHSAAQEAYNIINDTLKNKDSDRYGMIGNEKYKAALDLVIGDIDVNDPAFETALEKVKRYFEDDKAGIKNFYSDLVNSGIIDATTGAFDTTITEISEKLGITKDAAKAMMQQLEQYSDTPFDWSKLDPEGIDNAAESAKTLNEQLDETKQKADDASTAVDDLGNKEVVFNDETAQTEVQALSENISNIITLIETLNGKTVTINTVPARGQMNSLITSINAVVAKLEELNGKEVTVTVHKKETSSSSGSDSESSGDGEASGDFVTKSWGFADARGSWRSHGGRTLVGELGQELVVDVANGRWYTVGDHGAEFVNLPQNSIVFNHLQTAQLLGKAPIGKLGSSMASGNAAAFSIGVTGGVTLPEDLVDETSNISSEVEDANDTLNDIKDEFEEVNDKLEHYIAHAEQEYYVAERATDYAAMESALSKQVDYYRQIYENSMHAVAELQAAGATEDDEQLRDMEEAAWDAYQNMHDTLDNIRSLYIDALNDEIDSIQSAFNTLKDAVSEFNENGTISIDTFQSLLENGVQYLGLLKNENGEYEISTDSVNKLLQARKNQLAVETALSYVSRIREALAKGETETVASLIDATQDLGSSTWDLVYANLELARSEGLSDEDYEKAKQNIDNIRELAAITEDDLSSEDDKIGQIRDTYDDLNDQVEHYIKHLEQAQKIADRGSDYHGIEESVVAQIGQYQKIIENCNAAIEEMKAEGADDTNEDLQAMEEAAWSAQQSIWSLYDTLYSLRVDAVKSRLDDIQSAISDFTKAMEEINDSGSLTLDTFQSILDQGMAYLQFLNIEDGQLSINTEAVEEMIRARKEQLAVETAMSYLNQVEEALLAGEANKVKELVGLTDQLSENTWAAVYAKLALLKTEGLSDSDAAVIESYIQKLQALSSLVNTDIAAPEVKTLEEQLEEIFDAFNEIKEDLEHYIAHMEQKFTIDERALDYGGMTAALQGEIDYYSQIYAKAMETVQALKDAGADDTSAELQEAEEAAWSAYNSMNEVFDKMNALRVDALTDELSRLTTAYNNIESAVSEFDEHGAISLSSFQSLMSGGIQYLSFLKKEDGQYKMSADSLRDYISARKEQLALETAMQYIANIKQALENGEKERVSSLIDATNTLSASTWSLVFARAAELKTLGLTDDQYNALIANLEKLRDLTKDVESDLGAWDDAEDPIAKLKDAFEELNKEIEHYIAHQEHAYNVGERAWDFSGMEKALENEADYYRRIMAEAEKTIQEMKRQGADDTDESLQTVEETFWSAYDSLNEIVDKLRSLRVDALKEEVSNLSGAFKNLQSAAEDYNGTGKITLDTFNSIVESGMQYLSLLEEEDGKYVISTNRLNDYVRMRKEQLAIETALKYIADLKEAAENGEIDRMKKLVDATNGISSSTWSYVYAQAAALKAAGLSEDQYQKVIENIDKLRAIAAAVNADLTDAGDSITTQYESQQDALDKILKYTEDLIRAEAKDQIQAIKDEIDAYKEIIRLKKESLQQTKEEKDYQEEVSDKVKEIAKLQAKADMLALDTSRSANAERQKLMQEILDKQNELSKYQADHSYDAQVEALEKEAEAYEESRQDEIDAIEKSVSSEEKVYQLAIARIRDQWATLYADLIDWNTEQGSVINQEITDAWNEATKAVEKYGDAISAIAGLRQDIDKATSGESRIVADIPKYHGGGVTGEEGKLNDKEVLAVLEKGELVVDKEQKRGLYTVIDFVKTLGERLGTKIGNLRNLGVASTMMPAFAGLTVPGSAGMVENNNVSFNPTFDVHIDGGVGDKAAAMEYGRTIAETAANSLFDAFNRRGINNIQTLRQ